MSLQGLTIAMSLSGIKYLFQTSLQPSIASALQNMTLPAPNIGFPSPLQITYGDTNAVPYPPVGGGDFYWAVNGNVNLTNGRLSNFRPTFKDITQGADGEFTVKMLAENLVVDYDWNESYGVQKCYEYGRPGGQSRCDDLGSRHNACPYTMGMGSWSIDIVFKLQYSANRWQLALVSTNSTTANLSPNIPPCSIISKTGANSCATPAIVTHTEDALKNIAFGDAVNGALTPVFQTIPQSGQITSDIAFDFSMGPSRITFPNNSGLATGVVGTATWQGHVYPGTDPPQLKLPQVPTDHHLNYLISDYSVNALFWAFFKAGLLETVATQENTGGNASPLKTGTFQSSPLQIIYTKYPKAPMTANIKANTTPTVAIQQVYEPTAVALSRAQPPLPAPILAKLVETLAANVYVSEPEFFADLQNTLGEADADTYKTAIEHASLSFAAVVTHKNRVVMNVLWLGITIPVLTLDVCETDTLDAFVLAHSGTTQTLQFVPSVIPSLTTAKFVSSPLHGIDWVNGFTYIYNFALQPVFAQVATAVGKAGVALPRIKGFNFIFDRATISLEQGYANVLTDVMHTSDNGALYFQSKWGLGPAESHVAPASVRKNWGDLPPARPLPPPPAEWSHLIQSI